MGNNVGDESSMISDYFFPNAGGVESHIYHLAQCLIQLRHKVVVVTHHYEDRKGVRYLTNGLKVYYLPMVTVYANATLPSVLTTLPIMRQILIREQIELVHSHSTFSALGLEAILHATLLNIPAIFTDHSLYGFGEIDSIIINKVLKFFLSLTQHVICVSHTSKENTVLRTGIQPNHVSVIPNAVSAGQFVPDYARFEARAVQKRQAATAAAAATTNTGGSKKSGNLSTRCNREEITVVVISRLVYRKGIDLLVAAIPRICQEIPQLKFVIGGSGNKELLLQEMIEKNNLFGRVEMVGPLKHSKVRDCLVRGDIFLNTSLTEAFCIAIIEAASCGLVVVSTAVGGVPEVLPPELSILCDTSITGVIEGIKAAIERLDDADPRAAHEFVRSSYCWMDVAKRTELVYKAVYGKEPAESKYALIMHAYVSSGPFFGLLVMVVFPFLFLLKMVLDYLQPVADIELAADYPLPSKASIN